VNTDLGTLLTALYVTTDDYLKAFEDRPRPGQPKALTDAELVTLAVAQALLGFHTQTRWLRYAHVHLRAMFSYLPNQSGYNKRLRAALPLVKTMIRVLAMDSDFWFDNHPIVDSTPVPCGASRATAHRSDLAGWAHYGYCASHTRYFWGLRLYLVCTPTGMPILWALANPKIGEREVLEAMLTAEADVVDAREHLVLIGRQGLRRQPAGQAAHRAPHAPAPPHPQRREGPLGPAPPEEDPPAHRVRERHPQRAA